MTDLTAPSSRLFRSLVARIVTLAKWRSVLLLMLAMGVGMAAGGVVFAVGRLTSSLHSILFGVGSDGHLSAQLSLSSPLYALVPAAGGVVIALTILAARRFRTRSPVDPIEANAVYGGTMSFRESAIVTAQTVLSSGFGASVGLEAGYTQLSSSIASFLGTRLRLRRNEVRLLVGCGAAAAIGAAFNAPFTGAFYAFELIIGSYSIGLLAPVIAASLSASFLAKALGAGQLPLVLGAMPTLSPGAIVPFVALGVVCALLAIAIMLTVAIVERGFSHVRIPQPFRPIVGGVVVGALALISPAVLSTGHGALETQLTIQTSVASTAFLFLLKFLASSISLGSGFRGGLFFASLLMGALVGKVYGALLVSWGLAPYVDITLATVVGMASMAAGIVGGPLTMTFLVLETTGDLAISSAVMVAAGIAVLIVRELFGYSFSTWRLHLRGETIRSAHDVGRLRNLTVGKLMRADVRTVSERTTVSDFRRTYPLGSTERVVVTDGNDKYAGIVIVADAYQPDVTENRGDLSIKALLRNHDIFLLPGLNAADAATAFERADTEELAVLDNLGNRQVVGLLTEAHLLRRYAEELDKGLKDLTG